MKKIIATLLTIITALGFTLGFAGCKEKLQLPELTAEKAYYERNFSDNEWYYKTTDSSSNLVNFLNTEYREAHNENFYLVNFEIDNLKFGANLTTLYGYENDENGEKLFLYEWFSYKIDEKRKDEALDSFEFIFAPIEQKPDGELNFEYGEWYHPCFPCYYLNMYIGDTCIGTCFFKIYSTKKVTDEWFKTFFTENLIYWEGAAE